jgi:hypothetical protein
VRARSALLAAALAILAPAVARVAAADEPGAATLDMPEVERLAAEGAKWFEAAGDTEQPTAKRQDARNQAYTLLKKALTILDKWCDAHPDDVDKLDPRMVELHRMVFWLKKESPVPLGDTRPAPATPAAPEPQGPPPSGTAPPGGPAPSGPAPSGPTPGTAPQEPPRPAPAAPAARDPFAEAAAYEKSHPSDEPGTLERWLEALNAAPDPDAPQARDALARVAKLSDSLKQYYRKVRNDDPDSLNPEKDAGRAAEVAAKIAVGLGAPDAAARRAAAARLGDLGYTPAGASLYDALRREKTPEVRHDLFLALVRLGGRRACENVAKFAKDKDADTQAESVRSLAAIAQKDTVQARYAALALADFAAEARVPDAAQAAVKELARLGPAGVPGLAKAAASKDAAVELAVIDALGAAKDARGAPVLCERLDSDAPNTPRCEAAQSALRAIGRPAIPALIKALEKKKPRRLAGVLLYDLSGGQTFGEDAKAWADWWKTQK